MSNVARLLLILLAAAAAGGFNYHRNLEAEAAKPRPFQAYSQAELQALATAYEAEIQALSRRWKQKRGDRVSEDKGQLLDQRIDAYERASAHGQRQRALAGSLSEKEAALADLKAELAARQEGPWAVHLRRLLTI